MKRGPTTDEPQGKNPRMKIVLVCTAILLLMPTAVRAQKYMLMGQGTRSCGAWREDRQAGPLAAFGEKSWVVGFLSGVGYTGIANPLNRVDADGVFAWIDNYCQARPLKSIAEAAGAFVNAHPH